MLAKEGANVIATDIRHCSFSIHRLTTKIWNQCNQLNHLTKAFLLNIYQNIAIVGKKRDPRIQDPGPFSAKIRKFYKKENFLAKLGTFRQKKILGIIPP